jgi:hypothetical protein
MAWNVCRGVVLSLGHSALSHGCKSVLSPKVHPDDGETPPFCLNWLEGLSSYSPRSRTSWLESPLPRRASWASWRGVVLTLKKDDFTKAFQRRLGRFEKCFLSGSGYIKKCWEKYFFVRFTVFAKFGLCDLFWISPRNPCHMFKLSICILDFNHVSRTVSTSRIRDCRPPHIPTSGVWRASG